MITSSDRVGEGDSPSLRSKIIRPAFSLPKIDYDKSLKEVSAFRSASTSHSKDSIRSFLYEKMTSEIFPAWYGTDWDYNGISEKPREGSIACGYLVSTIMKQMGFNLNRYKLARQSASNIIKSTCEPQSIKYYNSISDLNDALKKKKGIYLIGLDYHVGFLIADGKTVWFFHSDYISDKVIKEKAAQSVNLKSSKTLLVGDLLGHNALLNKWMKAQKIKVST